MPDRVVVGVGNRDRGDDAAGPVVCDLVGRATGGRVRCVVIEGSPIDLPLHWSPDDDVVIVDAAAPDREPGRIAVVDASTTRLVAPEAWSTHAVDVGAAVELARRLGRLPARLTIVGIEGACFDHGAPLTSAVVRATRSVADAVAAWADGRRPWPDVERQLAVRTDA